MGQVPLQAVLSSDSRQLSGPGVRVTALQPDPWGRRREEWSEGIWVLAAADRRPLGRLLPERRLWGCSGPLADGGPALCAGAGDMQGSESGRRPERAGPGHLDRSDGRQGAGGHPA